MLNYFFMKKIFAIFLCFFFCFDISFWTLFISEVLPNTTDDTNLEYIEIYNYSTWIIDLAWYSLKDSWDKTYIFPTTILNREEKKKFFRPETKILLNNTDETLYLYDNNWNLIDTFSWQNSEKWLVITNPNSLNLPDLNLGNSWSIDSQTWTLENTWSLSDSWTTDFSSWNSLENTWTFFEIPDIEIEIQSWLQFSWTWKDYFCTNKSACKINLNLEKIFTWTFDISKYWCLWDFSGWSFTTIDTEKKCNPWYVNYWTWNFEVWVKVFELWNESNFKTWSINILNSEITSQTWEVISESWSSNDIPENNLISTWIQNIEIPEIFFDFQSPSYVINSDNLQEIFFCDTTKDECKINFNLEKSFSWYKESDFSCFIDLLFETSEKNKCNPNTIIFPTWENLVKFRIFETGNENNFKEKTIKIINNGKIISNNTWRWSTNSNFTNPKIYINQPKIIIQSGLDENNFCKKSDCSLNLDYKPENTKLACLWDFWWWIFDAWTDKKCNPWYVKYKSGQYRVRLRVYEQGNDSNYKEDFLYFKNSENTEKKEDELIENPEKIWENTTPVAKIKIQWKIWINKKLSWNYLECFTKDICSVNFDASDSYDMEKDKLTYFWDFWNWETSDKENPASVKYNFWKYNIKLIVKDELWLESKDEFIVNILPEEKKKDEIPKEIEKNEDNYFAGLKINKVLFNPVWADNDEFIELKNISNFWINLKSCLLDDKLIWWSKAYKIENDLIIPSLKTKKFYKTETKINLNNDFDEVNLICSWALVDKIFWETKAKEWEILWFWKENLLKDLKFDTILDKKFSWSVKEKLDKKQNFLENFLQNRENFLKNLNKTIIADLNFNNIPDDFEISSETWAILDIENYNKFIQKLSTQKVSKLVSGLKIYGKTLPFSRVFVSVNKKETSFLNLFFHEAKATDNYETISDQNWEYFIFIEDNLKIWNYFTKMSLIDPFWNNFLLEKELNFSLDDKFISKFLAYKKKQQEKILKKKKKKKKKTKKEISKTETTSIIPITKASFENKKEFNKNIFLLNIIIFIFWILLFLIFFRKRIKKIEI